MMKRESDRKDWNCLNRGHAQSFDRCEGQRSRFLVLTKRSAASGDENDSTSRHVLLPIFQCSPHRITEMKIEDQLKINTEIYSYLKLW